MKNNIDDALFRIIEDWLKNTSSSDDHITRCLGRACSDTDLARRIWKRGSALGVFGRLIHKGRGKTTFYIKPARRALLRNKLLSVIGKGKKYKVLKKMARLFVDYEEVQNWLLAKQINYKVTKKDYVHKKDKYLKDIRYRFRTLRKLWRRFGYSIKSTIGTSSLIQLPK